METVVEKERIYVMTDEEFYDFCQNNADYKFERDPDGKIITKPNTGGKTGKSNFRLYGQFYNWLEETQLGEFFDSSTAFRLPDGSTRSPDVAWIRNDRWNGLSPHQQDRADARQFPPLCPDFVIELVSVTDSPKAAKANVQNVWIANGCRLVWLIDPKAQTVHIFRANGQIQLVEGFDKTLSGEDVLPGFVLDLGKLVR